MRFYLGAPMVSWINRLEIPLFISMRRFIRRPRRTPFEQLGPVALDSGAFSELATNGRWTITADQFIEQVKTVLDLDLTPDFVAPQDWMTEPAMLKRTGLTVADHIKRTVANYVELQDIAPEIPWIPVLQGWSLNDYQSCFDQYAREGVRLERLELVGIGSICKRQHEGRIEGIIRHFSRQGVALHGFGVKTSGLDRYSDALASSDSMAWSFNARRTGNRCPRCTIAPTSVSCGNCIHYAQSWRDRVLDAVESGEERMRGQMTIHDF